LNKIKCIHFFNKKTTTKLDIPYTYFLFLHLFLVLSALAPVSYSFAYNLYQLYFYQDFNKLLIFPWFEFLNCPENAFRIYWYLSLAFIYSVIFTVVWSKYTFGKIKTGNVVLSNKAILIYIFLFVITFIFSLIQNPINSIICFALFMLFLLIPKYLKMFL